MQFWEGSLLTGAGVALFAFHGMLASTQPRESVALANITHTSVSAPLQAVTPTPAVSAPSLPAHVAPVARVQPRADPAPRERYEPIRERYREERVVRPETAHRPHATQRPATQVARKRLMRSEAFHGKAKKMARFHPSVRKGRPKRLVQVCGNSSFWFTTCRTVWR